MLSKEQILKEVSNGKESQCIDGRDFSRLLRFFPVSEWQQFGAKLKEGAEAPQPEEFTKESVLLRLKLDLDFGFEKALNQRGISAGCMYEVIKMWMWVLEDDLQHFGEYAQYGLPLFKAVATKYGFENPIGEDFGSEYKYSSEAN